MAKTLIAFFSRADENYFGGAMRYVKVGNTEIVGGLRKELIEEESRAHREAQVPHAPRTEVDSLQDRDEGFLFPGLHDLHRPGQERLKSRGTSGACQYAGEHR